MVVNFSAAATFRYTAETAGVSPCSGLPGVTSTVRGPTCLSELMTLPLGYLPGMKHELIKHGIQRQISPRLQAGERCHLLATVQKHTKPGDLMSPHSLRAHLSNADFTKTKAYTKVNGPWAWG